MPMKHRFQRYIVRTEILSTLHARVEYISGEQYVIPLLKTGLSARTQTDRHLADINIGLLVMYYSECCRMSQHSQSIYSGTRMCRQRRRIHHFIAVSTGLLQLRAYLLCIGNGRKMYSINQSINQSINMHFFFF